MANRPALNVFFPNEALRAQFKQLCAKAKTSMSRRAVELIKRDVAYWRKNGEVEEIKEGDLEIGLDQLIRQNFLQLADESGLEPIRLQEFVSKSGNPPTWTECNQLAEVLDMDVEEISKLAEKLYRGNNHESHEATRK